MAAKAPNKHARDPNLDAEVLLNDLQDWEFSLRDNEKKLKSKSLGKEKLHPSTQPKHGLWNGSGLSTSSGTNGKQSQSKEQTKRTSQIGIVGEAQRTMEKSQSVNESSSVSEYDYLRNYDAIRNLSSSFMKKESDIVANSEKELGNEYFKQKKFKEAIDCYSRSILLSPTAVAYANRAMAYLKIKRFKEAEDDCTEGLNLDDRYVKAYSRRSTARKELRKLKEAVDDAEFALRLEPHNQEIKKQYAESKSLYEKEIFKKASESLKGSMEEVQEAGKPVSEINGYGHSVQSVSPSTTLQRTSVAPMEVDHSKTNHKPSKEQLKISVQELAAHAASLAKSEAAKNITPPNSAYQFEVSWRGLSGDCTLQTQLLKVTAPAVLPQIFKNALSAPILIDIVRCIATIFNKEMDFSVKYLESLTKVSRFDIIIMCLSSADKAEMTMIWDDIFCNNGTPKEYSDLLDKLRSRYCPRR